MIFQNLPNSYNLHSPSGCSNTVIWNVGN